MDKQGSCVAALISILRQMSEKHYREYIKNFPTLFDLTDFLMEILCVFKDLVNRKVYENDWLEMVMIQNRYVHFNSLQNLPTIKKRNCIFPSFSIIKFHNSTVQFYPKSSWFFNVSFCLLKKLNKKKLVVDRKVEMNCIGLMSLINFSTA